MTGLFSQPDSGTLRRGEAFHLHLDVYQQCRERPFGLCTEGDKLLLQSLDEPVTVPAPAATPKPTLTFDEFAWRCLWLEVGRLSEYVAPSYTHQKARALSRRAAMGELWTGPYFERSEWAGMVRNWYSHYITTGVL